VIVNQRTFRPLVEFLAGGAVGSIVGLIAGLSVSPVTSTILGSLSTGLLVLLGFKASKDDSDSNNSLRVFGFGLVCSICLLIGIYIRTNGVLSPSLKTQDNTLANVFPDPILRQQILLLANFGMESGVGREGASPGTAETKKFTPGETGQNVPIILTKKSDSPASGVNEGVLRKGLTDNCAVGRRTNFSSLTEFIKELDRIDPGLKKVIESAPREYQDTLSHQLSEYICH
jgi:hypothetical protein